MPILKSLHFVTTHPLNRDNKITAVIRYIKWQVGSRLVPGGVVFNWVNNAKLLVYPGETGLTGNIYCGLHDFVEMGYLLHVIREDDLFVDVGANAGSYTVLACAAGNATGFAFEPVPATYSRLVDNIQVNKLNNKVRCLNIGIGDKPGNVQFTAGTDTTNHVVSDNENQTDTIDVEINTLDSILEKETPSIIKIDVEGYEKKVIDGAMDILKKPQLHSVIMELNGGGEKYGVKDADIEKVMNDLGFNSYIYNPFDRKLTKLEGKNTNSGNTLFIRNEQLVANKLKSANSFEILSKTI